MKRYPSVSDLPSVVLIEGCNVQVNYLQIITSEIRNNIQFIRPFFLEFSDHSNGILFFVKQFTFFINVEYSSLLSF